jgi:hypothetical protein
METVDTRDLAEIRDVCTSHLRRCLLASLLVALGDMARALVRLGRLCLELLKKLQAPPVRPQGSVCYLYIVQPVFAFSQTSGNIFLSS